MLRSYKEKLWQLLIAIDQLINSLISLLLPWSSIGWADETISARAWRMQNDSRLWYVARVLIDLVFLVILWDADHCQNSYASEQVRAQLPPAYRVFKQTRGN